MASAHTELFHNARFACYIYVVIVFQFSMAIFFNQGYRQYVRCVCSIRLITSDNGFDTFPCTKWKTEGLLKTHLWKTKVSCRSSQATLMENKDFRDILYMD